MSDKWVEGVSDKWAEGMNNKWAEGVSKLTMATGYDPGPS